MTAGHAVGFSGAGWEGPATWGQRALWDGMQRYERRRWCRNTVSVTGVEGSLGQVLAGIGELLSRHEALRTKFDVVDGELRQRVHANGEAPVAVEEGGPELVDALARELPARPLDAPGRLPVEFTVVTERGVPRHLVTALCFQNADGPSVRVLLDGGTGPPRQPREQHAQESGDAAARRSDRAIAHWLAECAKAGTPFRELAGASRSGVAQAAAAWPSADSCRPCVAQASWMVPDHPRPGVAQAALTSAAAAVRAERLALRTGATSSAVLTTAVAVAVAAATGVHAVPLQPFVSNRHLPGTAGYVGFLAQLCAMTAHLDPRATFADTVPAVQAASLRAYRNAWWSPPRLDAALTAAGLVPADVLGAACTVNDLRGPWPGTHAVPPDPGHDHAIRELPWWPYQGGRCAVAFTGGPELLTVALRLDTAYLPAELLPRLLRAVDGVLRAADSDPGIQVAELLSRAADTQPAAPPTARHSAAPHANGTAPPTAPHPNGAAPQHEEVSC